MPPAAIRYSISELELCGLTVNIHSFKHTLRNTEFTVIIGHSALLYVLNAKRKPPTLRLKKLIEVLSQYSFKVKFLRGKDMTISDFLSRHPGQDLASPNEIIQRQIELQNLVVEAEVHAPIEPEVPIEAHKPIEPFDEMRHPSTPEDHAEQETEVPEPLQVPIDTPQSKPMVPEQPLSQVLPIPRPMPLPDAIPKVPDQPIPFQGLIYPRPLDTRLLGTLPGYDDDIDDKIQPEVSIRQPDRTMYRKSKKLFDEIQDEMIFRKHLPRQLEINKFLEFLKKEGNS